MSIVTAQQLAKYYGAQDVFADLAFSIARDDKIALVGPNGVGKSTLLRIILGLEEPTAGSVFKARDLQIGYLPQKPTFISQHTLYGEMLGVFADLVSQQEKLLDLAQKMSQTDASDELLLRYAEAERRFDLAGGYTYENRIKRVLSGLGFGPESYASPIAILSGGQVTRAMLAQLLLQEPGLLILDEPTNYLDLHALEWLESYLQAWPRALLVVSHDRYFIDKVVSRVWELNHGRLETYRGNYSSYVVQKEARTRRQLLEYEQQQKQIAETEEFIRRYKAGQRSKEARGREERLNRLERVEPPPQTRTMSLRLSTSLRSGDKVLMSDGVLIGYADQREGAAEQSPVEPYVLFSTGELLIQRGQRVALLGPNGSGKTTLLRTMLGQHEPLAGRIRIGASVRIGYLPQTQQWLDDQKTILEQVLDASKLHIDEARHFLGRFLFSGDDVYKQIACLSGGERSRLALALLALKGANFLILDEPTTHLDLESQEILQRVLIDFPGTILLVSHDRYLVNALATHVWSIEGSRLRQTEGNYDVLLRALEDEKLGNMQSQASDAEGQAYQERRRLERQDERAARKRQARAQALEREIEHIEQTLQTTSTLIDLASASQDVGRVHSLSLEYQRLEADLAERLQAWEQAVSEAHEN